MFHSTRILLAAVLTAGVLLPSAAFADDGSKNAVYTMTNAASGNAVVAFHRAADGTLTSAGSFATGGTGGALGSGHSLVVSTDGRELLAVNAGSNSVSAFRADVDGLHLLGAAPSGGTHPTSVTLDHNIVYRRWTIWLRCQSPGGRSVLRRRAARRHQRCHVLQRGA